MTYIHWLLSLTCGVDQLRSIDNAILDVTGHVRTPVVLDQDVCASLVTRTELPAPHGFVVFAPLTSQNFLRWSVLKLTDGVSNRTFLDSPHGLLGHDAL